MRSTGGSSRGRRRKHVVNNVDNTTTDNHSSSSTSTSTSTSTSSSSNNNVDILVRSNLLQPGRLGTPGLAEPVRGTRIVTDGDEVRTCVTRAGLLDQPVKAVA